MHRIGPNVNLAQGIEAPVVAQQICESYLTLEPFPQQIGELTVIDTRPRTLGRNVR